ncbi:MAG: WD40 repeat domain-containing protein [Gemmataceae bacterium]
MPIHESPPSCLPLEMMNAVAIGCEYQPFLSGALPLSSWGIGVLVVLTSLWFLVGASFAKAQGFQQRKSDDWFWGEPPQQQEPERWFWGEPPQQQEPERWFWGQRPGKRFGPEVIEIKTSRGVVSVETADPSVEITTRVRGRVLVILDNATKNLAIFKSTPYGYTLQEGTNLARRGVGKYALLRGNTVIAKIHLRSTGTVVKVGEVARFAGHRGEVFSLDTHPRSGKILAAAYGPPKRNWNYPPLVWDITAPNNPLSFQGNVKPALALAYSPAGKFGLMGTLGGGLCICDSTTGRTVRRFAGHDGPVYGVGYFNKGRSVVSVGQDRFIRTWDVQTGRQVAFWRAHRDVIRSLAVSPDERYFLTGSADKTMCLWDVRRRQVIHVMGGHNGQVNCVAFSPDGGVALSGDLGGTIRLWDLKTGRALRQLRAHTDAVRGLAFSPDGGRFLSASEDGTVRCWDMKTGRQLASFQGHGKAWCVKFLADPAYAVSGGADKTVRVWRLPR